MSEFDYKMPWGCIVSGQVSHNLVDQITEAEIDWIGYCAKHDGIAEALAASRLELLRKSKLYFDWFVYEVPTDHVEGFEILLEELEEELGE